jgi:hypothetical protein
MATDQSAAYAVVGDVHGHLQLALCTLARWQRERGRQFSAVFLCGDVGTFTEDGQLDSATHRHARDNPCELEFLSQWSTVPPAPWLDAIFRPEPEGLGLCCPVVMVHGNHEGFAHLETLYPRRRRPMDPVPLESLPPVDTDGHILFLPPGWSVTTEEGFTVGGVGGMEAGQRRVKYHPMTYIEEDAVQHLLCSRPLDILLTHQGPESVQGEGHGSPTLDLFLDTESQSPRFWFHGHSTPVIAPVTINQTEVIPLGDIAFHKGTPGLDGWAILELEGERHALTLGPPPFWREARQHHWHTTPRSLLVHPDLVQFLG